MINLLPFYFRYFYFTQNMGNTGPIAWKVNGEEKYFKKENDHRWAEYVNGKRVFDFEFMGTSGDAVYLKKVGWLMYVRLDSNSFIYGESPNNLDKHLYNGTWVNGIDENDDYSPPEPESILKSYLFYFI